MNVSYVYYKSTENVQFTTVRLKSLLHYMSFIVSKYEETYNISENSYKLIIYMQIITFQTPLLTF